jgi:hypothetical protein
MPYQINHFNGTPLVSIPDGSADQTTDLVLIGKNYAGYGAIQNDNFVYLLENFASAGGPAKPQVGQIWYDSANKKLKFCDTVTNGVAHWRTTGGSEVATSQPSGLTTGDFWYNDSTNQLFAYNATTGQSYLIGPQAVTGQGETDLVSVSVLDNSVPTPVAHAIIKGVVNGVTVFVISSDTGFTLNSSETLASNGFSFIQQGITLVNSTSGITSTSFRFQGTATNSDQLGGIPAAQYLQADTITNVTAFPGSATFKNAGVTIGDNGDIKIFVDSSNGNLGTIENTVSNTLSLKVTNSSTLYEPIRLTNTAVLPGTNNGFDLGSNTKNWYNLYATNVYAGTITASNFVGSISGAATNSKALLYNYDGNHLSNYVSATDQNTGNTIVARDSSGNFVANIITATATKARYADLAENYKADADYEPGTVVIFGGENEITISSKKYDTRVAGVISTNPAYLMNQDEDGLAVALRGKVPVKVIGPVRKGDVLVTSDTSGYAMSADDPNTVPSAAIIGKSLENIDDTGLVYVVI